MSYKITQRNVLIIEDDPEISNLLEIHLADMECKNVVASNGMKGLKLAVNGEWSLIILDIMLPGLNGFDVCKGIREKDKKTPILMLTSKAEELDKVLGLELGADDYLTKPFSIRELIARIKAIFRRAELAKNEKDEDIVKKITFGDLVIDLAYRQVKKAGKILDLTVKEFELLKLLAEKPGLTFSRQQLLDIIWGYQFSGYEHTVNTHINRLRNKIESDPANPDFILTVWGVGYRLSNPESEEV
ncbi:MAG: response regulator transcription factor [Candidatus Marinimicrobia bacterium]|jgi:DNA-binding response OmpR family regulator|nr:response regulator transcription factor [Candidatus Neomarinimicrobiota bacterium]MBT3633554.1 response regulator transcription factor [Candidatus Neomarinimicrobiota bacterium]MBT3682493.1 response regulator transcription factor [Candidatus Neomarinimicrobiota bacterium]MBT3759257.1 response regulator transcription factor [Candidatus Neomarinimicrobiota bacterium]MBT3895470.1 response regulator transcription factor [Candidatus Neomarinimicrobiota bacterium]